MVLEALEKIRKAEEEVTALKEVSRENLRYFEHQKEEEVKDLQRSSNQKISALTTDLESRQMQELQEERQLLLKEAKELEEQFQENYLKNKEQMIEYIIERVKKVYGSQ